MVAADVEQVGVRVARITDGLYTDCS